MITIISSAKTMTRKAPIALPFQRTPIFQKEADELVQHMLQYSSEELTQILKINGKLANENYYRYRDYFDGGQPALQAILAYTGIVYKHINPAGFTIDEFHFAQGSLRIASFIYGLLSPFDLIKPYRMESNMELSAMNCTNMYDFWRSKFTDALLADLENNGNTLINLASASKFKLFNKRKAKENLRIITPEFKIRKGFNTNTPVVYIKMARGQMVRFIIKHKITDPEALKSFKWEGFAYNEALSGKDQWIFLNG